MSGTGCPLLLFVLLLFVDGELLALTVVSVLAQPTVHSKTKIEVLIFEIIFPPSPPLE